MRRQRSREQKRNGNRCWAAYCSCSSAITYSVFASRVCWRRISDQANGGGDKDLAAHSQSGGQFFGIHASNDGRIMIFAGGIPLKKDGKVVGAIGVSGGSGDQDH